MNISDEAKTILCYGDSLTYGRVPGGDRYVRSKRWTTILQDLLGSEFEIVSEGLPGRTFVAVDPEKPWKTGIAHLRAILGAHKPIDAVIVMLGTNDVKNIYNLSIEDISRHLEQTIETIQEQNIKDIFVVCPPRIIMPTIGELNPEFLPGLELSKQFPEIYKNSANKYNCYFVNSQEYISASEIDGVHLDEVGNQKLAEVLKTEILKYVSK